jgi:hypothetical protein
LIGIGDKPMSSEPWSSQRWSYSELVTLDLRRLRPVLRDLSPSDRDNVVKKMREAYPLLLIDLTPRGDLRIESL